MMDHAEPSRESVWLTTCPCGKVVAGLRAWVLHRAQCQARLIGRALLPQLIAR